MRYILAFILGVIVAGGLIGLLCWWDDERSYKTDVSRRCREY